MPPATRDARHLLDHPARVERVVEARDAVDEVERADPRTGGSRRRPERARTARRGARRTRRARARSPGRRGCRSRRTRRRGGPYGARPSTGRRRPRAHAGPASRSGRSSRLKECSFADQVGSSQGTAGSRRSVASSSAYQPSSLRLRRPGLDLAPLLGDARAGGRRASAACPPRSRRRRRSPDRRAVAVQVELGRAHGAAENLEKRRPHRGLARLATAHNALTALLYPLLS